MERMQQALGMQMGRMLGTDVKDEDGTDSAYKNISICVEEDGTPDHILTKILEEPHIIVSCPIPPPHNEWRSNPYGIKRRLIMMEQRGDKAYEEPRKGKKADFNQEYNQRALVMELSASAPLNRFKKTSSEITYIQEKQLRRIWV